MLERNSQLKTELIFLGFLQKPKANNLHMKAN